MIYLTHGNIVDKREVERKFEIEIDQMLISAIPKEWKTKVKSTERLQFSKTNPLSLKLDDKLTIVTLDLKCKKICKEFVNLKTKDLKPTAVVKWENLYPNHNFDWREIFTLPFKVSRETKLQSFQYQVLNRYIACNSLLVKWGKAESALCTKCGEVEDIEHLLYMCATVKSFWEEFYQFWQKCYNFAISLTTKEVLFGIPNELNMPELHALNFCVLMAKRFVYVCNLNGKPPCFSQFWSELKTRIKIEKQITTQNQKYEEFRERYEPLERVFEKWRRDNLLRYNHD